MPESPISHAVVRTVTRKAPQLDSERVGGTEGDVITVYGCRVGVHRSRSEVPRETLYLCTGVESEYIGVGRRCRADVMAVARCIYVQRRRLYFREENMNVAWDAMPDAEWRHTPMQMPQLSSMEYKRTRVGILTRYAGARALDVPRVGNGRYQVWSSTLK